MHRGAIKVGISGCGNLRMMSTDKWATSKSTQLSTKVGVKLLLLLENALKDQLSRVPWSGNSWMPFTFQPTLWALQQPHKHSHSLQLVIHTELAHYYIQ